MEKLETELFEAAAKGSVSLLQKLLKEDPLILDKVEVNCLSDTPLHVAAILGHTDFVKEIISRKPELSNDLNSNQSSPLHLASAKGHIDVVKALLSVDHATCLVRDKKGLTPLHLAALKGRVGIMKMLLHAKPDAAQVIVYRGENILHLCVEYHQLEALKVVVNAIGEPEFINSKDSDGNTVLHFAVADKQVETINFLLTVPVLEVNALNLNGMTAIDVLIQSRRDVRDSEIEESLKCAGAFGALGTNIPPHNNQNKQRNNWKRNQDEWLEKKRSALMVVASLIAAMAFQVGINPPGGVWQDYAFVDPQGTPVSSDPPHRAPEAHQAGFSILAHKNPEEYTAFYIINTISFIASLSIILLLMSGLPIRRRFFMWILMVVTWIAITATTLAYLNSIASLTPANAKSAFGVISCSVYVWAGLMTLLLIGHTVRLIVKLVKKLRRTWKRRRMVAGSAVLVNDVGF